MAIPSARTLQVVVGGVNGYADLAVASNFADGLSTGRLGLYTHGNGVIDEGGGGVNAAIGRAWSAQGQGVAEFGVYDPGFFSKWYPVLWGANGLSVAEADVNVNLSDPGLLGKFVAFVKEGRAVGHVQNFAPVFSPNSAAAYDGSQASLGTGFFDPRWAAVRAASVYGGGIAFDTPPLFAFWSPPWYLNFVEQEIRWGNAMGLRTSVIVSPYLSGSDYLADAQKFEAILVAAHAVPTQWVVESYDETPQGTYPNDTNFINSIGSEAAPNSEAAVADWFARNAPTSVLGPVSGSYRVQNADGTFGDTCRGSADGRTLVDVSAAYRTTYTYDAGGAQTGAAAVAAPPVLARQTANQSGFGANAFKVTLPAGTFADPAGLPLSLSARQSNQAALPSWLAFDPASGAFGGTAPNFAVTVGVRVTATAPDGQSASETFSLSVTPSRLVLRQQAPDARVAAGAPFTVRLPANSFVDTSGAQVSYAATQTDLSALPDWLRFAPTTGTFTGSAPAAASVNVRVAAASADGLVSAETFRISVLPAKPAFVGQGADQSLAEGQAFSFAAATEGPVAPSLAHILRVARQVSLAPLPSWIAFDAGTGVFAGTTPATPGSLAVRIDQAPPGGGVATSVIRLDW